MKKFKYIILICLISLMPILAFGLNIDSNSNDKVDVLYGGTDVGTLTDGGVLLGSGTSAITATP